MGMATLAGRLAVADADGGATRSSTIVFHAPHAEQRPVHWGPSAPQSPQR